MTERNQKRNNRQKKEVSQSRRQKRDRKKEKRIRETNKHKDRKVREETKLITIPKGKEIERERKTREFLSSKEYYKK